MKNLITYHRSITWIVLLAFFLLIQADGQPLAFADGSRTETEVAAPASVEADSGPGVIEQAGDSKPTAAKKHFPWLLVAGGIVVAGVVLYFTVIKKPKYDLTVTLGAGVQGSPAAGTQSYKKGSTVNYSYTAATGYQDPTVKLDGMDVAGSGIITMNAAHTLEVNANERLHDNFSTPASTLWVPYMASEWGIGGGLYRCSANRAIAESYNWNYNVYNFPFSQTSYTVTVRLQRAASTGPYAVLLATGNNMQAANGYLFDFNTGNDFYIARYTNYNLITRAGLAVPIQGWTDSAALNPGLGAWNVIKIVRSGSSYTLFVNNTQVFAMTDAIHDPRYVALTHLVDSNVPSQMNYDYVYVDVNSTPASAPFLPMQSPSPSSVELDSTGHPLTRR